MTEELKISLENWSNINNKNAENKFVDELLKSNLSASPVMDKFSIWLLAGTGITSSFMITNINSIESVISRDGILYSILALIISGLFGFLSKFRAIKASIFSLIFEYCRKNLNPVLDNHLNESDEIKKIASNHKVDVKTELDFDNIRIQYCSAFPFWIRQSFKKQWNNGFKDPLFASKQSANHVFWQGTYVGFQVLCFCSFLLVAVFFMK